MGDQINLDTSCSTGARSGARLITHRKEKGRVDMELDASVNEGWFYVYDAYNDGNLTGPEDKVTIGGNKFSDKKTCEDKITNAKNVKYDLRYTRLFQDVKKSVIQYYASRSLDHRYWDQLPPHNDAFFGIWNNFIKDDKGQIIGFKREAGDRLCSDELRQGVVKTMVDIDYQSFPEGLSLIVGAVWTAQQLRDTADKRVNIKQVGWDKNLCEAYGRDCGSVDSFWGGVLDYTDRHSNSCDWSFDNFVALYQAAPLQTSIDN